MSDDKNNMTISESKEESILKALALLERQEQKRPPLVRPKISLAKVLVIFFFWLIGCALLSGFLVCFGFYMLFPKWSLWLFGIIPFLVLTLVKAKVFLRNSILIYQKYAPEKLRLSCLYTPTCSEYMLLSIEKYGLLKGCKKGIRRLCRCHYPNGGEDIP